MSFIDVATDEDFLRIKESLDLFIIYLLLTKN